MTTRADSNQFDPRLKSQSQDTKKIFEVVWVLCPPHGLDYLTLPLQYSNVELIQMIVAQRDK